MDGDLEGLLAVSAAVSDSGSEKMIVAIKSVVPSRSTSASARYADELAA